MIESLVSSPSFLAFLAAGLVLAVTPAQTLSQGRRAGLASVGGIALGNLGNATAASIGLAAILEASAAAFVFVKFAGAAYLVFLGIRTLRAREPTKALGNSVPVALELLFRDGFFVALLNPKTALFFAALLPQFMITGASPLGQSLFLGSVFVLIAACTDSLYVLTASAASSKLRQGSGLRSYGRLLSAATFFGLGLYAAFASPRSLK